MNKEPQKVRKIPMKIFHSFEEADKDYEKYTLSLTPLERVSATEHLRRQYFLIKNKPVDLSIKKVIKIIKG